MSRAAAERFVVGDGRYTDDLVADDALWVEFVRSDRPHARLDRVDVAAAARAPGVVTVVTAADLDLPPLPPDVAAADQRMVRPVLADGTVRFLGEPVAAVVATSRTAAVDAAALVELSTEPLPAMIGPDAALADTILLHPAAGTNVCFTLDAGDPIDFGAFDVVVEADLVNQRVVASPLEGRAVLAAPEGGRLHVRLSAQGPHPVRDKLAEHLGVAPAELRVSCPDVGGGFGAKAYPHAEEVVVAQLARRFDRAVRWVDDRTAATLTLGHGRGQHQHVTLGGDADGTLRAYRLEVTQDAGAYPRLGAYLPFMARWMMSGAYPLDQLEFHGRSVVTTTSPTVAYRGAGRPEATAAIERAVDLFAAAAGLDPAVVRRANLLAPRAFPYEPGTTATYDAADLPATLERALAIAGYDDLRDEQRRRRAAAERCQLGIGIATYIEVTAASPWPEDANLTLRADGTVDLVSGTCPQGQGHDRTWRRLAASVLGVAPETIDVRFADSDTFATGTVTAGSRSAQVGGVAVHRAASTLAEAIRRVAAEMLEASPADLDLVDGRVVVRGSATVGLDLADVAAAAAGPLVASEHFTPSGPTYGSGTHVAVVEVDTELGGVTLARLIAVDDAGVVLDHPTFEGQVHGGLAQGVGQALFEEVAHAPDGTGVDLVVPRLSRADGDRPPGLRDGRDRDPARQRPRCRRDRRGGRRRRHTGGAERGRRCLVAPRRAPPRPPAHP